MMASRKKRTEFLQTLESWFHGPMLRGERDMYANLNNQVLHLANFGVTINEVHNVYEVPRSLQNQWYDPVPKEVESEAEAPG